MFCRFRVCNIIATSGSLVGLSACSSPVAVQSERNEVGDKDNLIAVFLSPQSRLVIDSHLQKLGLSKLKGEYVVLKGSATFDDIYLYQPLMGQKVAFRLKGILQSPSGAAGIGRMSTVIGEIRADDFEPSLQLLPKTTGYNYNKYLIDLPTRLTKAKILDNHSIWKGTLPPYVVHGREYTKSETLTLSSLPFTSQPVVEGILCLASNYDPQGHTCDLAAIDLILPEEMKQRNEPVRPTESNAVPEEDSKECPVCKYMKGGPCKSEFEKWEDCMMTIKDGDSMSSCYDITVAMMNCMKRHEYYDIMTAGLDPGIGKAIEEDGGTHNIGIEMKESMPWFRPFEKRHGD